MSEIELNYYNNAEIYMDSIANELCDRLKEYKPKRKYELSYYNQFKMCDLSHISIQISIPNYKNACVEINTPFYCTDKPYRVSTWKYNGEHFFYDKEFSELPTVDEIVSEVKRNLLNIEYEQMRLFEL